MSVRKELVLGSWRELGTVGVVAGLGGAYAAVLMMTSSILGTAAEQSGGGQVGVLLGSVATVFILIAVYISAVVITNGVDTVLSGRLRQIAMLRLLGARARTLRAAVMRGTAVVGLAGVLIGTAVGTVAADVFRMVLVHRGTLPHADYAVATPILLLTVVTIAGTAAAAGWVGSRSVLRVAPAQAMSETAVTPTPTRRTSRVRAFFTLLFIGGGALFLAGGAAVGEAGSAIGFLLAFVGSAVSGTGLLIGGRLVIPRLVGLVARTVGSGPASRIAGRNAVKDPLRTTRSTMGLVVGVALVTTFASGLRALSRSADSWTDLSASQKVETHTILSTVTSIMVAIVVISSVISAVGFVSTMSLTVIQRRREIGLLRSLGFTRDQVRRMITFESAALSGTAVGFGVLLGLVYGSLGAQSLIGKMNDGFVWGLPWSILGWIVTASVLLVVVASRPPARRAIRVTPIEAMRMS